MGSLRAFALLLGIAAFAPSARADEPAAEAADPDAGTSRIGFHGPFGGIRLRWSDDATLPGFQLNAEGDEFESVDSTDQSTAAVGGYRFFAFRRFPTLIESDTVGEGEGEGAAPRLIPAGVFLLGDAYAGLSVGQVEAADPERGGESFGAFGNGLALLGVSSNSGDGCGVASSIGAEGEVDIVSAWHRRDERVTGALRAAPVGLLCAGREAALMLAPYGSLGGGFVDEAARGTYSYGADLTFMLGDGRFRLQGSREERFGGGDGTTRLLASSAGRITPWLALGVDGSLDFVSDRVGAFTGDGLRSTNFSLMGTLVYTPGAGSGR